MKKEITKTVTEMQTFCDFCQKEVVYPEQCFICGKVSCNSCFLANLVEFRLEEFPKFWPVNQSLPMFRSYACPGCSNEMTRKFVAFKNKLAKQNELCKKWHLQYVSQINEFENKMKAKDA